MDKPERRVAIAYGVDEDAQRPDVVQRLDADLLAAHLAENAVDMLRPPTHVGVDAGGFQLA